MALQLFPPGTRKNNPFFLIRGMRNGKPIEKSTKTRDEARARAIMAKLERELADPVTWSDCADRYIAEHKPTPVDVQRIDKLKTSSLGPSPIGQVTNEDVYRAVDELYRGCAAATKNRNGLAMAVAVWHFGAKENLCEWHRVPPFEDDPSATGTRDQERGPRRRRNEQPARSPGRQDLFHTKFGAVHAALLTFIGYFLAHAISAESLGEASLPPSAGKTWLTDPALRDVILRRLMDDICLLGDALGDGDPTTRNIKTLLSTKSRAAFEKLMAGWAEVAIEAIKNPMTDLADRERDLANYFLKVGAIDTRKRRVA
jgi:hypothetical protein